MSGFLVDIFPDERGEREAERLDRPGVTWTALPVVRSATFRPVRDATPIPAGARRLTFTVPAGRDLALDPVIDGRLASLYVYKPRDRDAVFAFDARIAAPYTAGLLPLGELYGGAFVVSGLDADGVGELSLYSGVGTREAQEAREVGAVLPTEIAEIIDACRLLQDREHARFTIWVSPAR